MNYSSYLGLKLPSRDNQTDLADINVLSENFDTIDKKAKDIDIDVEALKIINNKVGSPVVISDSFQANIKNLILLGKTTQNGTPTPDAPVPLISSGAENGSITLKIQGEEKEQTLVSSGVLRGIPQTKVADVKNFGEKKTTQNIYEITFNGSENWELLSSNRVIVKNPVVSKYASKNNNFNVKANAICNAVPVLSWANLTSVPNGVALVYDESQFTFNIGFRAQGYTESVEKWKNYLASNPVTVQYELRTPIETPISDSEISAVQKLYTYKGNTTFVSEADMEVFYVADTKLYIDNKIAELTALTLEG